MAENSTINGVYFSAGSSRGMAAQLLCDDHGIELVDDSSAQLARFAFGEFGISDPLGNLPYRFDFVDGSSFTTSENHRVEQLFKHNNRQFRWLIHHLEGSWRWVALAVILLPLLLMVFLEYGLPVIAKPIATQIPQAVLNKLDRQVLESLDEEQWMLPSQASYTDNRLLAEAWAQLPNAKDYKLQQRDGGMFGANAFALPGGTIVVTDQLLDLLQSRDQILAVLTHEAGHVELQHGMRNIIQALGIAAVFAAVIGDVSWLAESILVSAPTLLQQMSYSREFEREADRYAIKQLDALGVPASCLGASLQNIMQAHGQTPTNNENESDEETRQEESGTANNKDRKSWFDYLSTHPATEERIAGTGGNYCY